MKAGSSSSVHITARKEAGKAVPTNMWRERSFEAAARDCHPAVETAALRRDPYSAAAELQGATAAVSVWNAESGQSLQASELLLPPWLDAAR